MISRHVFPRLRRVYRFFLSRGYTSAGALLPGAAPKGADGTGPGAVVVLVRMAEPLRAGPLTIARTRTATAMTSPARASSLLLPRFM